MVLGTDTRTRPIHPTADLAPARRDRPTPQPFNDHYSVPRFFRVPRRPLWWPGECLCTPIKSPRRTTRPVSILSCRVPTGPRLGDLLVRPEFAQLAAAEAGGVLYAGALDLRTAEASFATARGVIVREGETLLSAAEREAPRRTDVLRAVTYNLSEGVCTLNADGTVAFVNPAAQRLLGRTAGHACGRWPTRAALEARKDLPAGRLRALVEEGC